MNILLVIASGFLFMAGNIGYSFGMSEKAFWVPLALHILCLVHYISSKVKKPVEKLYLKYFTVLAWGNLIKQLFYTDSIKQINDFILGGIATIVLIVKLWENQNKR